jgi:uncharacterized protein (TIGR02453 family)
MIQPATIKFLKDLKKHNNKPWFDANRPVYESAKKDYETLIQQVIDKLAKSDETIGGIRAKECMFRINRDVRFAKDKSPYKTNFGAFINKGGKKSNLAGYYIHLEPGASFVGGGLWMPMPKELAQVRQEIDYCFSEFKKITGSAGFKKTYGEIYQGDDFKLQRVPKGYEADNPAAEFLKLKSFTAMKSIADKELTDPEMIKKSVAALQALQPLIEFINRAIKDTNG